jgi:oxazoline/thiazoline synthase
MKKGVREANSEKPRANHARRRAPLQETLRKYARLLDEQSGAFAALREYEFPWGGPVHLCRGELKQGFCVAAHSEHRAISPTVCGAGDSALQAKVSCLCEALERHSGIFRGDEPRRLARYSEIADEAIHPDALTLFSESQYNNRDRWNHREGRYNWVPQRFDAERSIEWSPAWSVARQRVMYLPAAYCYFGYPFDPAHDFCRPDSNGNAAGNDRDEAILHGFLELVERECVSVWWYNQVRRPHVDIESFSSPCAAAVCNSYLAIGRSVEVLDITTDRNVPTFVALSRSEDPPQNDYILGFGAHFDAQVALVKALTEMNQFLPDALWGRDPGYLLSAENGQIDTSFLTADEKLAVTTCSDFSPPVTSEPELDVLSCIKLVQSWGLEMLVVDQTGQDVGMPVVKVVVPGMRSWWARFAAGRLYTLPVQLGWLAEPKTESELNPKHLIL